MLLLYKNLFTNFHRIWQITAANNAKQCALKLSTSPGVCTHTTLNVTRDRIVTKYYNFT